MDWEGTNLSAVERRQTVAYHLEDNRVSAVYRAGERILTEAEDDWSLKTDKTRCLEF
jgi:hypothetical protein